MTHLCCPADVTECSSGLRELRGGARSGMINHMKIALWIVAFAALVVAMYPVLDRVNSSSLPAGVIAVAMVAPIPVGCWIGSRIGRELRRRRVDETAA